MKERTLFERLVLILGVIISTIVWVVRILIKMLCGVIRRNQYQAPSAREASDTLGTIQMYQSEDDPNEPVEGDESATHPVGSSDAASGADAEHKGVEPAGESRDSHPDVEASAAIDTDDIEESDRSTMSSSGSAREQLDLTGVDLHAASDTTDETIEAEGDGAGTDVSDVSETQPVDQSEIAQPEATLGFAAASGDVVHGEPGEHALVDSDQSGEDVSTVEPVRAVADDVDSPESADQAEPTGEMKKGMIVSEDGVCPASHPIKGNASSRIYHTPQSASYHNTKPEYCFATEEDAVAAGFRAPRRP